MQTVAFNLRRVSQVALVHMDDHEFASVIIRHVHVPMRAAVVQMTSTNDKAENLETAERLVREAKAQGAGFVALPECCNFFGLDSAESVAAAEDFAGDGIAAWSAMASRHAVWLALGGIKVVSDEPARPTNSHLLIAPNGSIVARYDKTHLFDIDLPEATFKESGYTKGGTELVCADTSLGRVGLSTCYDLRFPSLYAALTQRGGAEVVLVPAAWTLKTFPHWEILLRARAIETQSYVIAAAQVGRHSAKRTSPGGAMIVDPWGTVVARCEVSCLLCTVTFHTNHAHNLTRSP